MARRGSRGLLLLPASGAVIGLALALALPWPHGSGHSCPANGPQCFYPADLLGQRLLWAFLGLLLGLLLSRVSVRSRGHRPPRSS